MITRSMVITDEYSAAKFPQSWQTHFPQTEIYSRRRTNLAQFLAGVAVVCIGFVLLPSNVSLSSLTLCTSLTAARDEPSKLEDDERGIS